MLSLVHIRFANKRAKNIFFSGVKWESMNVFWGNVIDFSRDRNIMMRIFKTFK